MSENDDAAALRSAAEILLNNARQSSGGIAGININNVPPYDIIGRTHSINLFTEEFLSGYMQDGRMSVVRRFFCLFVTFDVIFVSLLWIICVMITGDSIYQAFQKQVVNYTIYTSLFDVVLAAVCRFIVLLFFYAFLYINHWSIITLSTTSSCLFLISKVFVFNWIESKEPVFDVILIITSFLLAWGEAWFLDCRVIPQERNALSYFRMFSDLTANDRVPLITPFLASQTHVNIPPESVANFYSPFESANQSDNEEDEKDEEYIQMSLDCLQKAFELFESNDWKMEKVTSKGDTIYSTQREKVGKIFKLTGRIKYAAKALVEELFYKIEDVPKWNPTLLESKIIRKINSHTDITYQATIGGGGGIVKSRDFVNLRTFRLFRNGDLCEDYEQAQSSSDDDSLLNRSCEGSISTLSESEGATISGSVDSTISRSANKQNNVQSQAHSSNVNTATNYNTLSKSLGAKGFNVPPPPPNFEEPPPLDETLISIDNVPSVTKDCPKPKAGQTKNKVWISAATSVKYDTVPPISKYTRGENIVSAFAFREIYGKPNACIFEWVLCLDLKGYIPRYVLDTAYTSFMSDYMSYLRKYVKELRQNRNS